jgi:uncharacterized membrane protein YraQ (UPF0718 family)
LLEFFHNTFGLLLISAPWLLFGLIAAGLVHAWIPMQLVGRMLGGSGPGAVVRAALIGAPLPLCSCGTLPAAFSLHRSGASRASTTSFLIATPETGVDSVALSWVLLGPVLAVVRPVAAIISAITAGLLVGSTDSATGAVLESAKEQSCSGQSCCSSSEAEASVVEKTEGDGSLWRRTLSGLHYAFTSLWDDIVLWLLGGILMAGVVVTLVPPDMLAGWGSGLMAMLLIMLISVPMYVCASASTPMAHAMLFAGVSPGTVLVFLLAGPASNLAGIMLVKRELGTRALVAYLIGVAGVSVLLGLLLDVAWSYFGLAMPVELVQAAQEEAAFSPITVLSLGLLVVMAIRPLRRRLIGSWQ